MAAIGSRRALAAPPLDPDAVLWRRAVFAAGGTVGAAQLARVSRLIRALKACGAWQLTDDYALYAAETQIQALVTLKMRITQTLVHKTSTDATFVPLRGFLGNQDGAIDTGWNPAAGTNNYAKTDARYGAWCYSAPTVQSFLIGGDEDLYSQIVVGTPVNLWYGVNTANSGNYDTYPHGGMVVGWHSVQRTASNAQSAYLNGALRSNGGQLTDGIPLANHNIFVLADNKLGVTNAPTDAGVSVACWGRSLSSQQENAEYVALRTLMIALGVA